MSEDAASPTDIGERIGAIRKRKGWSLSRLASAIDVGENAIRKIENGESKAPSFVNGLRIAHALGVSPWELAGETPGDVGEVSPLDDRLLRDEKQIDELREMLYALARRIQNLEEPGDQASGEA